MAELAEVRTDSELTLPREADEHACEVPGSLAEAGSIVTQGLPVEAGTGGAVCSRAGRWAVPPVLARAGRLAAWRPLVLAGKPAV